MESHPHAPPLNAVDDLVFEDIMRFETKRTAASMAALDDAEGGPWPPSPAASVSESPVPVTRTRFLFTPHRE